MYTPDIALYAHYTPLLQALCGLIHVSSLRAVSELVWALLACQSLHPAELARALPRLQTVHARQGMRRVRRILNRPCLSSDSLTPFLMRAALHLVRDEKVVLVLDSTRCLRWEVFTLGLRLGGRVLPIAWTIIPYPWPKNCFTPAVVAFLRRTLALWPADRPVHFLADRGFPSLKLFRELDHWRQRLPFAYTVRLRAGDWVRLADGCSVRVADLIGNVGRGTWYTCPASYQHRGKASPLQLLVFGRGPLVYPAHQNGPADQARRQARAQRRQAHIRSKGQSADSDTVWVLLTTAGTGTEAVTTYALRFSTEGSYRDLKNWGLEQVAGHETDISHLDGLIGLAVLGYFLQVAIGLGAGRTTEVEFRARQEQWSTTDRLSLFWRGRQVLHDHGHNWNLWLRAFLPSLLSQIRPDSPVHTQPAKRRVYQTVSEAA